jgi:hypothetical protein
LSFAKETKPLFLTSRFLCNVYRLTGYQSSASQQQPQRLYTNQQPNITIAEMVKNTCANTFRIPQDAKLTDIADVRTSLAIKAEQYIELDLGLPTAEDEKFTMPTEPVSAAAHTRTVEEEDLIDYDDDDLEPTKPISHNPRDDPEDQNIKAEEGTEWREPKPGPTSENQAAHAQIMLDAAKKAMKWSTETMLTQTTGIASALQLDNVGDAVTVEVSANSFTYDITWKLTRAHDPDPEALAVALPAGTPIAAPLATAVRCKFGRACNKGTQCPYSHTKLCTWVNTLTGCAKGASCEHSHEIEGIKCTRSPTRNACTNGRGCAFKHTDDVGVPRDAAALPIESKIVAPKGVKKDELGEGARQKRARDGDDEPGNVAQRQRTNNENSGTRRGDRHHRERGQGRRRGGPARGNSRGCGGAGGNRPELYIRGFATRGAQ